MNDGSTISAIKVDQDSFPTSLSLLRSAMKGDAQAWHTVIELYTEWIAHCCRKRGFHDADAADIAQNVLLKLFETRERFQVFSNRGAFRAWLSTTALNEARDLWTQRKTEYCPGGSTFQSWLAGLEVWTAADDFDDNQEFLHDRQELIRRVKYVIDHHLPVTSEHLKIFYRREIDGIDARGVAEEFGTTQGNVRQICWRIKQKIRELIDDQD